MELKIRCASWIKEDDEKVLELLQRADKMLSAEDLAEQTGLPLRKVEHTLKMLARQSGYLEKTKEFSGE